MAHEAGKGDKRRKEDTAAYEKNYDLAFGNRTPTRGSFIWDDSQNKLVSKEEYYSGYQSNSATAVIGDIQPYKSMITGEVITSRSKHREHLRKHGMVEVGNEVKYMQNNHERSRKESEAASNRALKEMVVRKVNEKFR